MTHKLTVIALAVGIVLATTVAPASASLLDRGPPTPEIARYGADANPSYIVHVENGSMPSLHDWATVSSTRQLISIDNASNTATVAAPAWEVSSPWWNHLGNASLSALTATRLADRSYIERIEPNYVLSTDPVDLVNSSQVATPKQGITSLDDPDYPTDGLAFSEDATQTTMAESRGIVGADNVSQTGSGVTVAVIDTGANTANGQVFGNGSSGSALRISGASKNFITNTTVTKSGIDAISDGNGHGTWTASAIAANTTTPVHDGVAPDASLLVLKALADDGSGTTSDITAAIRYAADHDADVISMSLGSPLYSQALADAVAYAQDQGSLVVVATGNSRAMGNPWIASPADVDGTVAVGATNGSEPARAGSAYFSQIGPDPGTTDTSNGESQDASVSVVAPGMATTARVASTDGLLQNSTLSGTSMATPIVAGSAALAMDAHPSWSMNTTRSWLEQGARPVPNAAAVEAGHGMVAVDNTVSKTKPDREQAFVMTESATQRQTFYETWSAGSGGLLPIFIKTEVEQ